jgi:hypothetical protein
VESLRGQKGDVIILLLKRVSYDRLRVFRTKTMARTCVVSSLQMAGAS